MNQSSKAERAHKRCYEIALPHCALVQPPLSRLMHSPFPSPSSPEPMDRVAVIPPLLPLAPELDAAVTFKAEDTLPSFSLLNAPSTESSADGDDEWGGLIDVAADRTATNVQVQTPCISTQALRKAKPHLKRMLGVCTYKACIRVPVLGLAHCDHHRRLVNAAKERERKGPKGRAAK